MRDPQDISADRTELFAALQRLNGSLADVCYQRFLVEQALGKIDEELSAAMDVMNEREERLDEAEQ